MLSMSTSISVTKINKLNPPCQCLARVMSILGLLTWRTWADKQAYHQQGWMQMIIFVNFYLDFMSSCDVKYYMRGWFTGVSTHRTGNSIKQILNWSDSLQPLDYFHLHQTTAICVMGNPVQFPDKLTIHADARCFSVSLRLVYIVSPYWSDVRHALMLLCYLWMLMKFYVLMT